MSDQQLPFPLAARGQLAYDIRQVDAFLERARATYDGGGTPEQWLTAAEIRQMSFKVRKRGYAARFVDAAMDRLEEALYERERRERMAQFGEEAWWAEVGQMLREVRGRLERAPGTRFRRKGVCASGYRRSQVDAFLDRVTALFAGEGQLTPAEVRTAVFHSQWRGYDEDQVDALLDAVVELLLATR